MPRHLFIVSRSHPDLYAYLLDRFASDPKAEVILDRRKAERRQHPESMFHDQRRLERRKRRGYDDELSGRSHFIVTLD